MKIQLSNRFLTSSDNVLAPGGELPDFPGGDGHVALFNLEVFEASVNPAPPMMNNNISWRITVIDQTTAIGNYEFRLNAFGHILNEAIDPEGSIDIFQKSATLATISVRRRNTGESWRAFGESLRIGFDETGCETIENWGPFLEDAVIQSFQTRLSGIAALRFKAGSETKVDWTAQRIRFKFPLEVVLNNFFNADFMLEMEIRFKVDPRPNGSVISAEVEFESNVNFHWLEDVGSGGSAPIIAFTLNKFMPTLLDCMKGEVEASILEAILDDRVGQAIAQLPGGDVFQIRIVPDPNDRNNIVNVIVCPTRAEVVVAGGAVVIRPNRVLVLPL